MTGAYLLSQENSSHYVEGFPQTVLKFVEYQLDRTPSQTVDSVNRICKMKSILQETAQC